MKRPLLALALLALTGCAHAPTYTLTPNHESEVMPNAGTSGRLVMPGGAHPLNALSDSTWLRWTMPTRCRVPLPGGVPWRTVCAPGADGLDRVTALRVTGRVASATWRLHAMSNPDTFRVWWPQVRSEADERVILLRVYPDSLAWRMPGARDSARVARWDCYSLAVANAVGWSCQRMVSR